MEEDDVALREMVKKALESKGVLAQIRASLRAAVFTCVDEHQQSSGVHIPNPSALAIKKEERGKLALEIVSDFLRHFELHQTLSILKMEAAVDNEQERTRQELGNIVARAQGGAQVFRDNSPIIMQLLAQRKEAGIERLGSDLGDDGQGGERREESTGKHGTLATIDGDYRSNGIEQQLSRAGDRVQTDDSDGDAQISTPGSFSAKEEFPTGRERIETKETSRSVDETQSARFGGSEERESGDSEGAPENSVGEDEADGEDSEEEEAGKRKGKGDVDDSGSSREFDETDYHYTEAAHSTEASRDADVNEYLFKYNGYSGEQEVSSDEVSEKDEELDRETAGWAHGGNHRWALLDHVPGDVGSKSIGDTLREDDYDAVETAEESRSIISRAMNHEHTERRDERYPGGRRLRSSEVRDNPDTRVLYDNGDYVGGVSDGAVELDEAPEDVGGDDDAAVYEDDDFEGEDDVEDGLDGFAEVPDRQRDDDYSIHSRLQEAAEYQHQESQDMMSLTENLGVEVSADESVSVDGTCPLDESEYEIEVALTP